MKLKNDFSEETRSLFLFKEDCDYCKMNNWDCLHHILGRTSDSPLNASTLHNFSCHIGNGRLSIFEVKKKFLKRTLEYLLENGYTLTEKDKEFIKKNKKYYD
jgi:hypothetical protein